MTRLDVERRDDVGPGWRVAVIGALLIIILIAVILSKVLSTKPSGGGSLPRSMGSNLTEVLDNANLPHRFLYGGMAWQAIDTTLPDSGKHMVQIGSLVEGHALYRQRGKTAHIYEELYLYASGNRTPKNLYVRYQPER